MTESQAFEVLHGELLLDPPEVAFAREFPDAVRQAIARAGYTVVHSELQGSLKKSTALSPLKDVDMFVSLDPDDFGGYPNDGFLSAKEVATRIADALISNIPSLLDIEEKHHALGLNLGDHRPGFDLVLAFEVGDGSGDLWIIDLDNPVVWKRSWPRADKDSVATANQAANGRLVHAVRQIKHAARTKLHDGFPGLAIEGWACRSSFSEASLPAICLAILERAASEIGGPVLEPAGRDDISHKISELGVDAVAWFAEMSATARSARHAAATGDHDGSVDLWHRVFGEPFPTSGRSGLPDSGLTAAAAALSFGSGTVKATRAYGG